MKIKRIFFVLFLMSAITVFGETVIENFRTEEWTIQGQTITVNISSTNVTYRFTHDGTNLLVLPWLGGKITMSKNNIVECDSLYSALQEIENRSLIVTEEQQKQLDLLEEFGEEVL